MTKPITVTAIFLLAFAALFAAGSSRVSNVSHAQSGGFDRAQYANDSPFVEDQNLLPETGEVEVMIELKDEPTAKVYAQSLGNRSDRSVTAQERNQARGAARAQMARIQ